MIHPFRPFTSLFTHVRRESGQPRTVEHHDPPSSVVGLRYGNGGVIPAPIAQSRASRRK